MLKPISKKGSGFCFFRLESDFVQLKLNIQTSSLDRRSSNIGGLTDYLASLINDISELDIKRPLQVCHCTLSTKENTRHVSMVTASFSLYGLLWIGKILSTATFPSLDWRAFHVTVWAINTTILRQRFQHSTTTFAVIKPLTGVHRHCIGGLMATFRAGDGRLWNHFA